MTSIAKYRPQGIQHFQILMYLNGLGMLDLPGVGVEYPDESHIKAIDKFGHYSVFECCGPDEIVEIESD